VAGNVVTVGRSADAGPAVGNAESCRRPGWELNSGMERGTHRFSGALTARLGVKPRHHSGRATSARTRQLTSQAWRFTR
jgi:hypothetical protein